ncbi:MAG: hypothetical protein AOA65_1691 [Candidatus Bathyarchaeota archaeon BA1]|nr:MAG: hypothetical protein AOA65_1691 [Candidatus Bathyarchaeota archaeon BA1]
MVSRKEYPNFKNIEDLHKAADNFIKGRARDYNGGKAGGGGAKLTSLGESLLREYRRSRAMWVRFWVMKSIGRLLG